MAFRCLVAASAAALWATPVAAWDYTAQGNDWGSEGFCQYPEAVEKQSPIDLPMAAAQSPLEEEVVLHYPIMATPAQFYATEHSLAITLPGTYKGGFGLTQKGSFKDQAKRLTEPGAKAYRLWQMEFHSPSEHKLGGERAPLEVQLSHKRADSDEIAMISVLFEPRSGAGARNPFLDAFIDKGLPLTPWSEKNLNLRAGLNIDALLRNSFFLEYEGSLTTPPCETGVRWLVRRDAAGASMDQLIAFQQAAQALAPPRGNYRQIPMNTKAYMKIFMLPSSSVAPQDESQMEANEEKEKQKLKTKELESLAVNLADNPLFKELHPDDSEELLRAKEKYKTAELDDSAARTGKAKAARNLRLVKDLYDASPGLVGKIDRKWKLMDAENQYKVAVLKADEADKDMKATAIEGAETMLSQKKEAIEIGPSGGKKELRAHYVPEVHLPDGKVGNPFEDNVFETLARAGPDKSNQQTREYSRLANNLRQPALRLADAPVPELETDPPAGEGPPPTPPPVAQITLRMLVPQGSVKNAHLLAEDLTKAMVDGIDGQYDRVEIAEARRIAL